MMQQERRSHSRKTLNPLPYISLGPDKGGIVLDVSEQGLRFRATTPMEELAPIHFSFSAHSDVVEGVAELIWTDQANKTGGLRFTELADETREVIRKWPHESQLQLSVGQDFMLHMPASDESSHDGARGRGVFGAAVQFASRLEARFKDRKSSFLVLLSIGIMVILASSLSYVRHREVGEWLVRLGTRISGEGQPQTVTRAVPSTPSIQPPGIDETSGSKPQVDATQQPVAPQATEVATPAIPKRNVSKPPLPQTSTANTPKRAPVAPGRELVVQVAALRREADARDLADSLRQKNFQAFVRTLPPDSLYRVILGPYASTAAARTAVDQLKKAGFDSFVRREPSAELTGSLRIATP